MKNEKGTRRRVPSLFWAPERRRYHFGGAWTGCPGWAGAGCAGEVCAGAGDPGGGKVSRTREPGNGGPTGVGAPIGAGASFTTDPERVEM
jgi:hypothetical protein